MIGLIIAFVLGLVIGKACAPKQKITETKTVPQTFHSNELLDDLEAMVDKAETDAEFDRIELMVAQLREIRALEMEQVRQQIKADAS